MPIKPSFAVTFVTGMTLPMDNFFVRRITPLGLCAVTLIMGLITVMFVGESASNRTVAHWVEHTYQTIGHVQALLGKLKDAELGERGYPILSCSTSTCRAWTASSS